VLTKTLVVTRGAHDGAYSLRWLENSCPYGAGVFYLKELVA